MESSLTHGGISRGNDGVLSFITCGSVDDGKSTLIGRMLVDTKAVMQDQIAGVSKTGAVDLALLTDGLAAEREQGITIDVAYRYFATPARKFIIGDSPGHEQYTRNMVTAASNAQAAVVLVDATKLDWQNASPQLLPQTRRHSLLLKLLRVPTVIYAINKLDAIGDGTADAASAYANIQAALRAFTDEAGVAVHAVVPVSALLGFNVVQAKAGWCGYAGESLLKLLEEVDGSGATPPHFKDSLAFPVQWVEKFSSSSDTSQGRRVFWGKVASGAASVGDTVTLHPSGKVAKIAQVLSSVRELKASIGEGLSAGIILDQEIDLSRGDWLFAAPIAATRALTATLAWLGDEAMVAGRTYDALHGHKWIKAKVKQINHVLDIEDLSKTESTTLLPNAIGEVVLGLSEALPVASYAVNKPLGSLILVDTATHQTAAAVLVN